MSVSSVFSDSTEHVLQSTVSIPSQRPTNYALQNNNLWIAEKEDQGKLKSSIAVPW